MHILVGMLSKVQIAIRKLLAAGRCRRRRYGQGSRDDYVGKEDKERYWKSRPIADLSEKRASDPGNGLGEVYYGLCLVITLTRLDALRKMRGHSRHERKDGQRALLLDRDLRAANRPHQQEKGSRSPVPESSSWLAWSLEVFL
jgi:hypothetical protein